ncbi:Ig domain-containing protein [Agromyces aerolatus]|uniref:Ig domain-containing protein n=1 Tax=Agromyces sp. LY-1074 TaxID=3074080 RepID=UPI002861AD3B|nr:MULTISPECIES: Ig domain-containing protein [unclassified Agromyces]MDR5700063.1 Ig domain-containing protein [Agromyces sp. LY-1074]MDR5706569.1 Ig domain-containing protein [Agromyces sp. LY-1358]
MAQIGVPYDFQVTFTGRANSILASWLPAGLTMDAKGRISGRPSVPTPETRIVKVAAFDLDAMVLVEQYLPIRIDPLPHELAPGVLGEPPHLTWGTSYAHRFALAGPGTTVRVTSGSLPPGLTLTAAGSLVGTLTNPIAASYSFEVEAANEYATAPPRRFTVVVPTSHNYSEIGVSTTQITYYMKHYETKQGIDIWCPAAQPDLIDQVISTGRIVPYGVQIIDRVTMDGNAIWLSAAAQEKDGFQAGIKGLHMYNHTFVSGRLTVTLHCTNNTGEARRY